MSILHTFDRLAASATPIPAHELFALFDGADAIDETAFMHGEWSGGVFKSGHPGEAQLAAIGWVGKRFTHDDDVDPIVGLDAAGRRAANPVMGKASLRLVVYRDLPTATMIYDKHPIFDHFRRLTDELVIGVMDRKGEASPLFFYLQRLPAPGTAA